MNGKTPGFSVVATSGTRHRLVRIVRRCERKGARMARVLRVALSDRKDDPPDRLRRAGLI